MSPGSENTTRAQQAAFSEDEMGDEKFVAALDIGTTTLRCCVFDQSARIRGCGVDQIELLYPQPGFVEIDPEKLWTSVKKVVQDSIKDAGLTAGQLTCLGISVQRSSFTTWHKKTGTPFHNIILWRDVRADKLVHDLNKSFLMKGMRTASKLLYTFTRRKRFLVGSQFKIMNTQVTARLLWVLENVASLKNSVEKNEACFGTLDTWIIYKLTGGQLHVTDVSNASCTGFFDPFTMEWASWAFHLYGLPQKILPRILDTCGDFGLTSADIFGYAIPIRSCVADQSASLFGSCSFNKGDIKLTLGTGSFLNVNTGDEPHGSLAGLYPVVGWKNKEETVYMAEAASNDTGTTIRWAQKIGIIEDPSESSEIATLVQSTDGVCFIPSFSGIQAPVNDGLAAAGLIGLKPTTSKHHMMRAILESIVFRVDQMFEICRNEIESNNNLIRIDGGVSKNDFVSQLISDLTELPVERPESVEMSALGAAYLAGLASGVWTSKQELIKIRKINRTFTPRPNVREEYQKQINMWRNALTRFLKWYPDENQ